MPHWDLCILQIALAQCYIGYVFHYRVYYALINPEWCEVDAQLKEHFCARERAAVKKSDQPTVTVACGREVVTVW